MVDVEKQLMRKAYQQEKIVQGTRSLPQSHNQFAVGDTEGYHRCCRHD